MYSDHLSPKIVAKNQELVNEIQLYINQHHRNVVINDPFFCNRTFATATYACPQMMGNHMHEFLNSFIGAYVSNRTMIWRFCDRKPCKLDNEDDCNEVMKRSSWILSYSEYVSHWDNIKCAGDPNMVGLAPITHRQQAEEMFACCGIDQLGSHYINIDFGTHESHQMYSLALPNARLGDIAKNRAKMLFQNGEDFGYGMLLRASFQVMPDIRKSTEEILNKGLQDHGIVYSRAQYHHSDQPVLSDNPPAHSTSNSPTHSSNNSVTNKLPLYIAMHVRHATNEGYTHSQDMLGQACVEKVIQKHESLLDNHTCVILLASDRSESFPHWQNATHTSKLLSQCILLNTNHSESHISWNEHGPFSGHIAVHDIDLLSHAHLFVGSSYLIPKYRTFVSTFSLLISELHATNGLDLAQQEPALWLPECQSVIGGRRYTKDMFANWDTYKCEAHYLSSLNIPKGCLP